MNNTDLYQKVNAATSFMERKDLSIQEQIYILKHNITRIPRCAVCNTPTKFRKDGINVGYPENCSRKCSNINPNRVIRRKKTSWKKYGTELPQQHQSVKNKSIQTNLKRYNSYHKNQVHIKNQHLNLLYDRDWLTHQHHKLHRTLTDISNQLNVDTTTVQRHLHKHGVKTKHFYRSEAEQQICKMLDENKIKYFANDRTFIFPHEIDIFIPEHNIAIEYCGLYWHSEQNGKHKHYHKNKYDLCRQKGIQLLTIFSDEWEQKEKIVRSTILHKLKHNYQPKIFARNLKIITNIDCTTKEKFLNKYHIQGNGQGSINIGLATHNNNIVALMTFIVNKDNNYILNRYATSVPVIGGFSKILRYFENNYNYSSITTFADQRWSDGSLYKNNGFVCNKVLTPDYYYSTDGHNRIHKFNFRRKNLDRLLNNFDPQLSERQNCDNNGILRIWDCGKQRWIRENLKNT